MDGVAEIRPLTWVMFFLFHPPEIRLGGCAWNPTGQIIFQLLLHQIMGWWVKWLEESGYLGIQVALNWGTSNVVSCTRTPQLANGLWHNLPMAVLGLFASHWSVRPFDWCFGLVVWGRGQITTAPESGGNSPPRNSPFRMGNPRETTPKRAKNWQVFRSRWFPGETARKGNPQRTRTLKST